MDTTLLATKLRIPLQPNHTVHRARLIDALEHDIPNYKLLLISAPAGYGKTTVLAEWARSSHLPIVWLSISHDDNDVERFLRYLLTGWEQVQPDVKESSLGLLLDTLSPDSDAVLSAFINAAIDAPDHLVFVLDDYHLVEDPSIHSALVFLLDHLPPTLHIVLAGRAEPPLPLARYRARHQMLEFRADDLQFSLEETEDFLNSLMRLDYTRDEVMALQAQVEGWIAGLQLVALSRTRRLTVTDTLVVSGRHRFIADYLTEDVLAHLPDDKRRFLLRTSILDHLCGALCDAVTEDGNGQAMLETLEHENMFLVPLDDQREWFRYHHLFADFLQGELTRRHQDDVATLHRRAARWYLVHDLPEPAFRHALTGEDFELVLRIFERYFLLKVLSGEITVVQRWLELLPDAWRARHLQLIPFQASILFFTGQIDACVRYLDDVERLALAASDDMRWPLARVAAMRCFVACFNNDLAPAEALAFQALQDLPEDDLDIRHGIYGSLGDVYRQHGRWDEAKECYWKALDRSLNFPQAATFRVQSVDAFGALADLDLRQGHLRGAATYWRRALEVIGEREGWRNFPLPLIGWVHIRLGEILYEWNALGEANECLAQGLKRAELGGDLRGMIAGYLLAARLGLTAGDLTTAGDYLERARPLVENAAFPDWAGRFGRMRLEFWLTQHKLHAAVECAHEMMRSDALEGGPDSEIARLALARVLIVKGDDTSLTRALTLIEHILPVASEEGRAGVQIEALTLLSLVRSRRGDLASAMISLERALRMAEPEGYVRLFADLGLPMARLLQEARSRAMMQEYVEKLLGAFDSDLAHATSHGGALPEPLSPREKEVLRLISTGLTNREIAETLVISPETVKKHTGSIYGKLSVDNRTEAAARARELDLLG